MLKLKTNCHFGVLTLCGFVWLSCGVGCFGAESSTCGDAVCGPGLQCDPVHGLCVYPSQLVDCVGVADGTHCSVRGEEGYHCDQEVCVEGVCGDGVLDALEACDDGEANSDTEPDACRSLCVLPRCGDDVIDLGEACDDGTLLADDIPDRCRTDCTTPVCGDGVTDGGYGEGCDDVNGDRWDGCDTCVVAEVQVNTTIAGTQTFPAVAMLPGDRVLVVWESEDQDGDCAGIFGQVFGADGQREGGEFQVNADAQGCQWTPAVAANANGEFVVAWGSPDADDNGIYARRFSDVNTPAGGDFQVNTVEAGRQSRAVVTVADDFRFAIAWSVWDAGFTNMEVQCQGYDASGNPAGGEFQVNATTAEHQSSKQLALSGTGVLTAVWRSVLQDGDAGGIYLRRFDVNGTPLGGEILVNEDTLGEQSEPSLFMLPDGSFTVAWISDGIGVLGRRFDAAGASLGASFMVAPSSVGQTGLTIAGASDNSFVAIWEAEDADYYGVYGQRVAADGSPSGDVWLVNHHTDSFQADAVSAMLPDGRFAAVWRSDNQDGDQAGIYLQRFDVNGVALGMAPW